jgi:hypothetical protein
MNELEEARALSGQVGGSGLLVSTGRSRPYPNIPGGFAKKGFKADIDQVCDLVEKAFQAGATNVQCDEVATWLEGVLRFYLRKHKLKNSGGAVAVSLKHHELAAALKRKVKEVTGLEV